MAKIKVSMGKKTYEFECDEQTTILAQGLDQGIDLPYACMSGVCTSCQAKLLKGDVKMDQDTTDDDGYILTCQACPKSSVVELEIE